MLKEARVSMPSTPERAVSIAGIEAQNDTDTSLESGL
jgi:hypothetical protein